MSLGGRKLVVLGIPWDIDSEGLRQYMSQFGELADVMVMKNRASGRSRGFGYVTFSCLEDAEKALSAQHNLNGRTLEVKVATPKEEMAPSSKKTSRIFVARIPPSVTDEDFHSYFMKYGPLVDAYMPKDPVTKQHRGIGFVTYENPDSVDHLISETHELGGSRIAIDRATPKEDSRGYRVSSHYLKATHDSRTSNIVGYKTDGCSRTATNELQADKLLPSVFHSVKDNTSSGCASIAGGIISIGSSTVQIAEGATIRAEKKMFIGRVPVEATAEDLQAYFSQFGWVVDVYLPKDAKRISHRGFAFVTFADEASATRVSRLRHFIHGREIAVDFASPTDRMHGTGSIFVNQDPSTGVKQSSPPSELVVGAATENESCIQPSTSSTARWGKKLFIGRIPMEASAIDIRLHFSQFGHVLDVYLPKDDRKTSHRGFGFVTFAEEISAEYASQKVHRILGQKIVLDRAAPLESELSTDPTSTSIARTLEMSVSTQQNIANQQTQDTKKVRLGDSW
ncbi:PREDICTED: ELAV-like protein 1 isoform X2 [Nelumbo nucifera]|uniref:ELAV-like protein 1 isoform X2 n=1 Tax=Nelumbo nucifera TaxID=4432 RepID=A0A1U8B2I4_NELNU|nr:PREDICTED: ELAV-like protein 1 isoform X2 [Nelumbo nucifera]